jgi:hypothetical protein
MTDTFSLFRSLIVYGICLPLAIFLGYLLATPDEFTSYGFVGLLVCCMSIPLLLKWHYPLMLLVCNSTAGFFFLPGRPTMALVFVTLSFIISFVSYIMNRDLKFISVPSVARPLICLAIVVLYTAKLTGGMGMRASGSTDVVGGKRYIYILLGVLAFFAVTALRIPREKAMRYVILYYLGALSGVIGNLVYLVTPSLYFIFLIFPADLGGSDANDVETANTGLFIARLGGLAITAIGLINLLLLKYGIAGVFKKNWRLAALFLLIVASMYGGFRSMLISIGLLMFVLFCLEGLMKTKLLPAMIMVFILASALMVPFASKLPVTLQRTLAFVPWLDLDPEVVRNAQDSTDWRLQMWEDVLPTIPQYLILGKGCAIDAHDLEMVQLSSSSAGGGTYGSNIAGDYHNGPLSVIVPFGIPGSICFIWFLVAGWKALARNYRYGDVEFVGMNRFLYATYITKVVMFFVIFGALHTDLFMFTTIVGLSVAVNGGVKSPAPATRQTAVFQKFRLAAQAR